jgi:citrate lyase subunit beta / citryl-CoA lyase
MSDRPAPRTWLYVPGDAERKIDRARSAGADAVILDLEDGTPPERKDVARELVAEALRHADFPGTQRWVRVNDLDGDRWSDDVEAVVPAGVDGLVLPKVWRVQQLRAVRRTADAVAAAAGVPPPPLGPIVTENPRGVLAMQETLSAVDGIAATFWGSEDLSAELGTLDTVDEDGHLLDVFRVVRSLFLVAAAAAGLPAVDTPWLHIDDHEGLLRQARAAHRTGFSGMQAIHPAHVPTINDAFLPTAEQVAQARRTLDAFGGTGGGAVRVDGAMADPPHLRRAERILARAAQDQERDG